MIRIAIVVVAIAAGVAGCASTKTFTPMERHLNRAAGAEVAAQQCAAVGGYASVAQMREDAISNEQQARAMGATDADLQAARERTNSEFAYGNFMVGPALTCNKLISTLAWVGAEPAAAPPVQPVRP